MEVLMNKRTIACLLLLSAFAVNAANGGKGGDGEMALMAETVLMGPPHLMAGRLSGRNKSGSIRAFYLPGTKKQCNPGKQDAMKSARQ
jgi:hypothetical protein